MQCRYSSNMATEIIQIRDVPAEDVAILRQRAAARNQSLAQYLREMIHEQTSRPTMAEWLARLADDEPIEVSSEEVRSFIEEGRRY